MDKLYKTHLLKYIRAGMKSSLPDFQSTKITREDPAYLNYCGSLLFKKSCQNSSNCVWLIFEPGEGTSRNFFAKLGWTIADQSFPVGITKIPNEFKSLLFKMRTPIPSIPGTWLDIEELEGKSGIGGIFIPSPLDKIHEIPPLTPQPQQRELWQKLAIEDAAIDAKDREAATQSVVNQTLSRVVAQLESFERHVIDLK